MSRIVNGCKRDCVTGNRRTKYYMVIMNEKRNENNNKCNNKTEQTKTTIY